MLGEVEGFSLALNYTAEDRRRRQWARGGEKGWYNGVHRRSYLSSLNRCRPGCSLYCSTKAFWQKHTRTHMHTLYTIPDKSMHSGFSNFPRYFALPPSWVRKVTKPAAKERISYFLTSFFSPCLLSFSSFLPVIALCCTLILRLTPCSCFFISQ